MEVHTGTFAPSMSDGIKSTNSVEVLVSIESADDVNKAFECTKAVVSPRGCVSVRRKEPSIGTDVVGLNEIRGTSRTPPPDCEEDVVGDAGSICRVGELTLFFLRVDL